MPKKQKKDAFDSILEQYQIDKAQPDHPTQPVPGIIATDDSEPEEQEHWSSPAGCHQDCPACKAEELQRKQTEPPFKFNPRKSKDTSGTDTGRTNGARATSAQGTLSVYIREAEDVRTGLQDFLSDAMHLCDREGLDFDDIVRMAQNNWQAER